MKKKSILLLFIFLAQTISFNWACINEFTGTNAHNVEQYYHGEALFYLLDKIKPLPKDYQEREKELLNKLPENMENITKEEMKIWSDFAVALIYNASSQNEKLTQAIEILEKMLLQFPNEYNLYANIGTAFELQGNPEKALFHIKKSLEINTDSHKGSEWIHVKILEGKIAFAKNPNFFVENPNWLGISFGIEKNTSKMNFLDKNLEQYIENLAKNYNHQNTPPHEQIINKNKVIGFILQHFTYQLGERINFVSPKDIWVGDILQLLGDLLVNEFDVKQGLSAYEKAKIYTTSKMDLLEKRIQNAQELLKKQNKEPHKVSENKKQENKIQFTNYIYAGILAVLVLGFLLFWFFKRKKR